MQTYLANDRAGLARLNAPVFFYGQLYGHPPCIATWAYQGTPNSPDIYDAQNRTKPAKRCDYANVGCECRTPELESGNPTPAFPVYFAIRQCSETEIRVTLNLFYEKDGAICWFDTTHLAHVDVGHNFDWEGVVIIYKKSPTTMLWSAEFLLMSQHGGYEGRDWLAIKQTLSSRQAALPDPRHIKVLPQGQNHPVVYVGWLKHPHFDFKYTFPWGWPLQLTKEAFRSDDWWQLVDRNNLIEASDSTPAGRVMLRQNWGEATSIPPQVDQGVCSVPLRNGLIAGNNNDSHDASLDAAGVLVNGSSVSLNGTI